MMPTRKYMEGSERKRWKERQGTRQRAQNKQIEQAIRGVKQGIGFPLPNFSQKMFTTNCCRVSWQVGGAPAAASRGGRRSRSKRRKKWNEQSVLLTEIGQEQRFYSCTCSIILIRPRFWLLCCPLHTIRVKEKMCNIRSNKVLARPPRPVSLVPGTWCVFSFTPK